MRARPLYLGHLQSAQHIEGAPSIFKDQMFKLGCRGGVEKIMPFHQGSFMTRVEKPHIPACLFSPVLGERLALAQGQPCDLSHSKFPTMLRV